MPCDYSLYPPNWKSEIRPRILDREGHKCKFCNVTNYAVGRRVEGAFFPTAGNIEHDAAGRGELAFKEAASLVKHCNEWCEDNLIMIILTVAHLDHDLSNNADSNLAALCQRCHLLHDKDHHRKNARETRRIKTGQQQLL